MARLKPPKNQRLEVLYQLLLNKELTGFQIIDKTKTLNHTSKITELRKQGVDIRCVQRRSKSKFGNTSTYGVFSLANKIEATRQYEQLNA